MILTVLCYGGWDSEVRTWKHCYVRPALSEALEGPGGATECNNFEITVIRHSGRVPGPPPDRPVMVVLARSPGSLGRQEPALSQGFPIRALHTTVPLN